MDIKVIKLNGYDIEVLDAGDKSNDTIIFAHGLGSNLRQFEPQIKIFENDYRVVSYSLQGHGNSEHPTDENSYTIESYYKTIADLFNQLDIENCIWVGNSMGGVLGYEVIKQQPDKIKLLITNGTTPELIYGKGMLKTIYAMDRFLIKAMKFDRYVRIAAKNSTKQKELYKDIYGYLIKSSPQAVIYSHQILGNYSYIDEMKGSSCPVVIIQAPYDNDINKSLKKSMKHIIESKMVEIVELSDAGHLANIEKPIEYTNIIVSSIKKHLKK